MAQVKHLYLVQQQQIKMQAQRNTGNKKIQGKGLKDNLSFNPFTLMPSDMTFIYQMNKN